MRLIDAEALYREVKTECNPYGKPTIGYEDGNKVLDLIDEQPTIPDIDRAAILRLCNEIECIVHEIYNTGHMMQNCDYDAIFNRVKKIGKELTGNAGKTD